MEGSAFLTRPTGFSPTFCFPSDSFPPSSHALKPGQCPPMLGTDSLQRYLRPRPRLPLSLLALVLFFCFFLLDFSRFFLSGFFSPLNNKTPAYGRRRAFVKSLRISGLLPYIDPSSFQFGRGPSGGNLPARRGPLLAFIRSGASGLRFSPPF